MKRKNKINKIDGVVDVVCALCTRAFITNTELISHVRNVHKISSELYYVSYIMDKKTKVFCYCGTRKRYGGILRGYPKFCSRKCRVSNVGRVFVETYGTSKHSIEYVNNERIFMVRARLVPCPNIASACFMRGIEYFGLKHSDVNLRKISNKVYFYDSLGRKRQFKHSMWVESKRFRMHVLPYVSSDFKRRSESIIRIMRSIRDTTKRDVLVVVYRNSNSYIPAKMFLAKVGEDDVINDKHSILHFFN